MMRLSGCRQRIRIDMDEQQYQAIVTGLRLIALIGSLGVTTIIVELAVIINQLGERKNE